MGLLWRRRSELHPEQIRAIEGLDVDGKYLLLGPPGCGKTSILLHRGQYIRGAGGGHTNIRLVTFARTLKEFIAVNGDERFPPELIQTVASFVNEVFDAYNESQPDVSGARSLTDANLIRAQAALDLLTGFGKKFEFGLLLVDEVQDLCADEVSIFDQLAPRQMIAGDSRQQLYNVGGGLQAARDLGYEVVELENHFRISQPICIVADNISIVGDYRLVDYCRYTGPTPPAPQILGRLTKDRQIEQVIRALDIQLDTYSDPEDLIGIVVQKKSDCDHIAEELEENPKFRGKIGVFHSGVPNRRFDRDWKIWVLTLKSCKGLEFRALHWLFVDEDRHLTRSAAYTVVTRAKTSLNVYHHNAAPGFLTGAFPSRGGGLFEDDE